MVAKPKADWEAIGVEYRAGQISVRAIAANFGVTEGAIRKKAKAEGWQRALADKVRDKVREKLARADGTHEGTQEQRAKADDEIIDDAAERGVAVVNSHRRDLSQLHEMKRIIASRLLAHLKGDAIEDDLPFIGDKESPGDLLEKLARVTSRLVPLERQAFNLDSEGLPPSEDGEVLDTKRLTRAVALVLARGVAARKAA